jgi:hypothetical protein
MTDSRTLPVLALALLAQACSCNDPARTTRVAEDYSVVQGSPAVDTGKPRVEQDTTPTPPFLLNVPRQCDYFDQNSVNQVDILWVVDNSGSMKASQTNLADQFPKFIQSLMSLQPPVDFHIGVTSMDVDNDALVYDPVRDPNPPPSTSGTKGALHGFDLATSSGPKGRYISCCVPSAASPNCPADPAQRCNVSGAMASAAFAQMSRVGTGGSPVERGLYASYLALTRPDNLAPESPASPDLSKSQPFIRPDAALFVVYVSDEDDSSCEPFAPLDGTGRPTLPGELCQQDPGCRCNEPRPAAPNSSLTFGSRGFFVRFLESYKGYGHKDKVAAGAVVCTEKQLIGSQSGESSTAYPHQGCPDDGTGVAYFGDRYIEVAEKTGGSAISIRGSFANALQSLGFVVSGLRKDFRLSQMPITGSLEVYVTAKDAPRCQKDAECPSTAPSCRSGRCASAEAVGSKLTQSCPQDNTSLEYCLCDSTLYRNLMRFSVEPPSLSSIEVCYDVNTTANPATVCQ